MFRKVFPILLLGGVHLMFLSYVVIKADQILLAVSFISLIGYFFFKYTPVEFEWKEYLTTILLFGVGFFFTSETIDLFSVTPVYASALVGIVFSFFLTKRFPVFPAIVYSGSFAGMVTDFHSEELYVIFSIILIGGNLFYFLKDNFNGLGGKLGSIGFGSMLFPILIGSDKSLFDKVYEKVLTIDPIGDLSSSKMLFFTVIVALVGTVVTYWLNNKRGLGPIKSSAISSFIIAIPLQIVPFSGFLALIPIVFFGASFVGMTNEKTLGWFPIIIVGVFYGVIFHFTHPFFNGYGGTLGTTACLCCLLGVLIQKTFNSQTVRV